MTKSILLVILIGFFTFDSDGQIIVKPGSDTWAAHEANIAYTHPKGWQELDTTFNNQPLTYHFLYTCIARWGFYNPEKDMYLVLGTGSIRSFAGHPSDSAANNYYLSRKYLSQDGLVPLKEDIVTPAMLKEAHVDDVVTYQIKLDTPFLGKYRYAKRFLLHRQDVANVTLNFVAVNKSKEREINRAFKETWGMVRFRPDSAFHPEFKMSLVGKFRHLRPALNTKDSLKNVRNRKRMHFRVAVFNGKSAVKAKRYKQAKEDFLTASHILPDNPYPIKQICRMYLHYDQLDSAVVYLAKLQKDYLSQNPKLLSEIKYGWALWYEKRGMYDSAIVVNKQLLKLRPENAGHIYFALGDNYRKTGSYKTALKAYKKAQQLYIEKFPHHRAASTYNYRIGECYEQLSNRQLAKKYFKKAQEEGYALPEEVKEKYEL